MHIDKDKMTNTSKQQTIHSQSNAKTLQNVWLQNHYGPTALIIYNNRDLSYKLESHITNKDFSFYNFHLFRAPRSSTGPLQMKLSMTFIRGNRCIEMKIYIIDGGVVKQCFVLVNLNDTYSVYIVFCFQTKRTIYTPIFYAVFQDLTCDLISTALIHNINFKFRKIQQWCPIQVREIQITFMYY